MYMQKNLQFDYCHVPQDSRAVQLRRWHKSCHPSGQINIPRNLRSFWSTETSPCMPHSLHINTSIMNSGLMCSKTVKTEIRMDRSADASWSTWGDARYGPCCPSLSFKIVPCTVTFCSAAFRSAKRSLGMHSVGSSPVSGKWCTFKHIFMHERGACAFLFVSDANAYCVVFVGMYVVTNASEHSHLGTIGSEGRPRPPWTSFGPCGKEDCALNVSTSKYQVGSGTMLYRHLFVMECGHLQEAWCTAQVY